MTEIEVLLERDVTAMRAILFRELFQALHLHVTYLERVLRSR
jgi:hypothetical protein